MIFRTHIAFSLLIGFLAYFNNLVDNWILFFLLLFIGAGFPDVDHKKSKFGRNLFSRTATFFSKHRKIFHSLFFGIIAAYLAYTFDNDFGLGFLLGFFSHILLDSFTKEGINFLYPFGKFAINGFVRTGGKIETFLFYFLVAADITVFLISK